MELLGATVEVLFVSSEIYPLAKTGGLADVKALARLGVDIRNAQWFGHLSSCEDRCREVIPGWRADVTATIGTPTAATSAR